MASMSSSSVIAGDFSSMGKEPLVGGLRTVTDWRHSNEGKGRDEPKEESGGEVVQGVEIPTYT